MSTAAITGSPISVTGLASGLDTKAIITALLEAEKQPISRLTKQSEKVADQSTALQSIKSSLLSLTFAAAEFKLPSLFEGVQAVTSSEPARVAATVTSGAGVGGYQIEVTQLANSAQKTFKFASPAAEDKITIGGREYTLNAGASAAELASKVNGDGKGTVYAAVVDKETIVFSSRSTGTGTLAAITVTDPGGALTETAGTAKEGQNAEYKLDGVAGTSASNVLNSAIPGVSLSLQSLTGAGPVTISVQAPTTNVKPIETQLQSFVTLYNSTVEAIQKQLSERPLTAPATATEAAIGTLFGDRDLSSLLNAMRQSMYEPITGLPSEMASPTDVGVSTGAAAASGGANPAALAGVLKLDPTKLASAIQANPEGAKVMLQQWSSKLTAAINKLAEPGATLESRINGDNSQVREMKERIATMNEQVARRQKALEQIYANLEGVISKNTATGNWLSEQSAKATANSSTGKVG